MLSKIIGCATLLAFADAVKMSSAYSEDTVINPVTIPWPPLEGCEEENLGDKTTVEGYPFECEQTDYGTFWNCPSKDSLVAKENGD